MTRLRQQLWFTFAAVWLAGSISMYWSVNVRVAESPSAPVDPTVSRELVKRWMDLDSLTTQTQFLTAARPHGLPPLSETQNASQYSDQKKTPDTLDTPNVQSDLVALSFKASDPLSSERLTQRQKPRDQHFTPVLFEESNSRSDSSHDWFSGGIELSQ